jgi:hypothetical protein
MESSAFLFSTRTGTGGFFEYTQYPGNKLNIADADIIVTALRKDPYARYLRIVDTAQPSCDTGGLCNCWYPVYYSL